LALTASLFLQNPHSIIATEQSTALRHREGLEPHAIAPDYPGYGYSDTPPADQFSYTFDHLADVIASKLFPATAPHKA
jgi:pimeloyl-ACP methyl ester carboxylesterase